MKYNPDLKLYASRAMAGMLASCTGETPWPKPDLLAQRSFEYALAMIAEENRLVALDPENIRIAQQNASLTGLGERPTLGGRTV